MTEDRKRFVILRHDHPFLHWDFLLERDELLESWRLLREPVLDEWIRAEKLPDHRSVYLTYEGPVSGDRGYVSRVLSGSFQSLHGSPELSVGDAAKPLAHLSSLQLEVDLQPEVDRKSHLSGSLVAHLVETSDGRTFWTFRPPQTCGEQPVL